MNKVKYVNFVKSTVLIERVKGTQTNGQMILIYVQIVNTKWLM